MVMNKKVSEVVKFTLGAGYPQTNSPENVTVEIERPFHSAGSVRRDSVKRCAEIRLPKVAS
jgi:hypothetical protein